jgi:hypothetical protein
MADRSTRATEHGVAPVLAGSGSEEGFYEVASRDFVFVERAVGYMLFEMVAELGSDQVPEDIVVVVDQGYRDVDLGCLVRFVSTGRTVHELETLG